MSVQGRPPRAVRHRTLRRYCMACGHHSDAHLEGDGCQAQVATGKLCNCRHAMLAAPLAKVKVHG